MTCNNWKVGSIYSSQWIRRCFSRNFKSNSISIGKNIDDTSIDLEIFQRLSKVYKLLATKSKFKYTAYKCTQVYEATNGYFFEDLLKYPRINNDMIKFLMHNYPNSSSIRILVLNDIKKFLLKGKIPLALEAFAKLQEGKQLHENLRSNTIDGLSNFLISQATLSGEAMLAASYAIEFHNASIDIYPETLKKLFRSLAVDSEVDYLYQCFTIVRLIDIFGMDFFESDHVDLIGNYVSKSWIFSKIIYSKFQISGLLLQLSQRSYQSYRHKLIKLSLDNLNNTKALQIWNETNIFPISSLDIPTLKMLLKANQEKTEEIIQGLPPHIVQSSDVIDTLLLYYGTTPNLTAKFDNLVKLLRPPIQRLTLSLLFQSFLFQNKEQAAESVLQSIFKTKNGISKEEFNAIIVKLLNQGKIDQCLGMVKTADINVSKLAFINIFGKLLELNKMNNSFLQDLYRNFSKLAKESDNSFSLLSKMLINHFSQNINNRLAKKTYITIINASTKPEFESAHSKTLKLEQFDIPNTFRRILLITNLPIQIEIVQSILLQAMKERDNNTLRWGIDELRYLGLELEQILKHLKQYDDDGYLNEIFHEEVLQTCK